MPGRPQTAVSAWVADDAAPALDLALAARGLRLERAPIGTATSSPLWLVDADRVEEEVLERLIERAADVVVLASHELATRLSGRYGTRIVLLLASTPAPLVADHVALALERRVGERDGLTSTLSKRAYWQKLAGELVRPGPHSIINLDIDHFKRLNDQHGHQAGDAVLRTVAQRIEGIASGHETPMLVARYGGEEFSCHAAVAFADAMSLAEAMLEAVRAPPCADIDVTVSAGVASSPNATEASELFAAADEALYAAKAAGRDRVVGYEELAQRARASHRDVALDAFETRTRVIAERVAEAITARGRVLFEKLQHQADVDPVTALFSRGYLDRRLGFEVESARGAGTPLTVALIDIDHFGEVNKAYGWPTGDAALRDVADAVGRAARKGDWVARYGGEELCVVMLETTLDEARAVLERIRKAVAVTRMTSSDGRDFRLTVSIGAASVASDGEPVLERASARLLEAKRAGRNRLAL